MFSENLLDRKSRELLETAKSIASKNQDSMVDTDHLLMAFISKEDNPLVKIIEKRGIDTKSLKENITNYIQDLYSQINKAVSEYTDYIKNLYSQLSQVRTQALEIYRELKKNKSSKRKIKKRAILRIKLFLWWRVKVRVRETFYIRKTT